MLILPMAAACCNLSPSGFLQHGNDFAHVFLTRQDATTAQVDALVEQYKGLIAAGGGKVSKVENWGVKSLAFRITKNRKAHYTFFNIDAPSAAVVEMERQMSISEDVIR